ncbi:uncharacterized protein LOC134197956 [Corticium candelabrum]|uniref:uncharacterized protein LOC134197956 n=1 Tax=Corticium candelabrum TaxID=121492 RepID=UPI002E272581|nr:uncharacterized protein LOC134197956 [Corticium candelabrum]
MNAVCFVFLLLLKYTASAAPHCLASVQQKCSNDTDCQFLLKNYLLGCASVFAGQVCSETCKTAYDQLLRNSVGSQYYSCSCYESTICNLYKNNLLRQCFDGVAPTPGFISTDDSNTGRESLSCVLLNSVCNSFVSTCQRRYQTFIVTCQDAFDGFDCSSQCNYSVYHMLRHPVTRRFLSCDCLNDTVCRRRENNLLQTCYNGTTPDAPPPDATPTIYAQGTCEALLEECFSSDFQTCGKTFLAVEGFCAQSPNPVSSADASCSTPCEDRLRKAWSATEFARKVSTCNCTNGNSSECLRVSSYSKMFERCGFNGSTDVITTPAVTQIPHIWCESVVDTCKNSDCVDSVPRAFRETCAYLFADSHYRTLSLNLSACTNECRSDLTALADTRAAIVINSCVCMKPSSSVCQKVSLYRSVFLLCDIEMGSVTVSATVSATSTSLDVATPTTRGGETVKTPSVLGLVVVMFVQCFVTF